MQSASRTSERLRNRNRTAPGQKFITPSNSHSCRGTGCRCLVDVSGRTSQGAWRGLPRRHQLPFDAACNCCSQQHLWRRGNYRTRGRGGRRRGHLARTASAAKQQHQQCAAFQKRQRVHRVVFTRSENAATVTGTESPTCSRAGRGDGRLLSRSETAVHRVLRARVCIAGAHALQQSRFDAAVSRSPCSPSSA